MSLLRRVQGCDGHKAAAGTDDDDDGDDDGVVRDHSMTLSAAVLTARRLYLLSSRIKSSLRRELKSASGR